MNPPLADRGTLTISGLRLSTLVGTYPHERQQPQVLLLDLVLEIEAGAACHRDELAGTVDYEALCHTVVRQVAAEHRQLIERVAMIVLETVLATPGVLAARVRVTKPGAVPQAAAVSFELAGQAQSTGRAAQ